MLIVFLSKAYLFQNTNINSINVISFFSVLLIFNFYLLLLDQKYLFFDFSNDILLIHKMVYIGDMGGIMEVTAGLSLIPVLETGIVQ